MRPRLSILYQLHALSRLSHRLVTGALAHSALSGSDFALYSLLAATGAAMPSQLAAWTGSPLPTASKQLGQMEERGHLERVPNPEDGRSILVRLTDLGAEAHAQARPSFVALLDHVKHYLGGAHEDVSRALSRLESALRAVLGEEGPGPEPRSPVHRLAYEGPLLDAGEEEQVRDFISWLQFRQSA